jgi:hypothetical protein
MAERAPVLTEASLLEEVRPCKGCPVAGELGSLCASDAVTTSYQPGRDPYVADVTVQFTDGENTSGSVTVRTKSATSQEENDLESQAVQDVLASCKKCAATNDGKPLEGRALGLFNTVFRRQTTACGAFYGLEDNGKIYPRTIAATDAKTA